MFSRSVQEITPVDFACETMVNVNKELTELISIYRSEPKRTINPFSMRLQGVIDANVMGGISKYQEAFFSEQFLKSPTGQGQAHVVQRLKTLILEQLQILEMALELHGQLAPTGVQPLHKRLLERFVQLRQNLSGLGKLKRQHSESIVNTPLPPLPIEKRAMSLGGGHVVGNYESDDIYTRPSDNAANSTYGNRETLVLPDLGSGVITFSAPPVPARPKSAGYVSLCDSPEVPPKGGVKGSPSNAPPLPPRGYTPDKRASNPLDFDQNRRGGLQKYSVVDISLDDSSESEQYHNHIHHIMHQQIALNDELSFLNEFRDSGISTSSNDLNNLSETHNVRGHHKTNSNPEAFNINSVVEMNIQTKSLTPPPIPPKVGGSLIYDSSDGLSSAIALNGCSTGSGSGDGYCVPKSSVIEPVNHFDSN